MSAGSRWWVRSSRLARWRGGGYAAPGRRRAGGRWPSTKCGDAEATPKSPASAHTAADGRVKPARGGRMLR